jgi:hypothetical protein
MRRTGLSIVEGSFLSGKTQTAVALAYSLLISSSAIKEREVKKKLEKKVKTYTIKEMLENESSEEEDYRYNPKTT